MNSDLISRSELKKEFAKFDRIYIADTGNELVNAFAVDKLIDNAPTVEPDKIQAIMSDYLVYRCEPQRPQGEWKLDDTEQFCYCSNCEDTYYPRPLDPSWYFCPHCGAKMKGGAE